MSGYIKLVEDVESDNSCDCGRVRPTMQGQRGSSVRKSAGQTLVGLLFPVLVFGLAAGYAISLASSRSLQRPAALASSTPQPTHTPGHYNGSVALAQLSARTLTERWDCTPGTYFKLTDRQLSLLNTANSACLAGTAYSIYAGDTTQTIVGAIVTGVLSLFNFFSDNSAGKSNKRSLEGLLDDVLQVAESQGLELLDGISLHPILAEGGYRYIGTSPSGYHLAVVTDGSKIAVGTWPAYISNGAAVAKRDSGGSTNYDGDGDACTVNADYVNDYRAEYYDRDSGDWTSVITSAYNTFTNFDYEYETAQTLDWCAVPVDTQGNPTASLTFSVNGNAYDGNNNCDGLNTGTIGNWQSD